MRQLWGEIMFHLAISDTGIRRRLIRNINRLLLSIGLFGAAGILPALATDADYKINSGDILQISVWKEEGLDREVLVLPDGTLSFPLIGEVVARGKTTAEVSGDIKKKIAPMFTYDPQVLVSVKAALGNTVSVIGQVTKPGELILGRPATVMQALSMAGGLTPYASESRIIVLRRENGKDVAIPFPYDDVSRGRALESNVVLHPGDVVVVPTASLF